MLIEQAIFTSTQTHRAEGYQLVAASPGLTADDRRELAAWGPSHDSLVFPSPETPSVNFFPMARGAYCVSRTSTCAGEYSGRGGLRYYTQFLVVPVDGFRRFTNNPFAVLRAAAAQGALEPLAEIPPQLPPLRLTGRCAVIDHGLLTDLTHEPGAYWLTSTLAGMLATPRCALAAPATQAPRLVAGLLNCLPVETRVEFSFTTGLRLSPRRPFRIVCLPPEPAEMRRVQRQHGPVFEAVERPGDSATAGGWAGYVRDVLHTGRTSALATALANPRSIASLSDLDAWGEELRQQLDVKNDQRAEATEAPGSQSPGSHHVPPSSGGRHDDEPRFPRLAELFPCATVDPGPAAVATVSAMPGQLSQAQHSGSHEDPIELLDLLDDAVFDAIAGKSGAVEQLRTLWPQAARLLAHDVLEESKAHYLRYALDTWRQCQEQESVIDPARSTLVLDVLAIVLE